MTKLQATARNAVTVAPGGHLVRGPPDTRGGTRPSPRGGGGEELCPPNSIISLFHNFATRPQGPPPPHPETIRRPPLCVFGVKALLFCCIRYACCISCMCYVLIDYKGQRHRTPAATYAAYSENPAYPGMLLFTMENDPFWPFWCSSSSLRLVYAVCAAYAKCARAAIY